MRKFNVSADLLVPVLVEIEADNEDQAIDKLHEMSKRELLRLANTEEDSIGIVDDGVSIDRGPETGYCAACSVSGHDRCSLTAGCPCCDDTIANT